MATYDDIRTDFIALLNRRDCTSAQRDAFLSKAIQRIQRDLRCPAMEKSVIVTIDSNYATTGGIVIPSDLLELIDIIPQGDGQVERLAKADITRVLKLANQSSNIATLVVGRPREYARQGGIWVLGPAPQVGDTIRINYYAELATLSAGTDTNAITILAPDLIVDCALSRACTLHFNDKRGAGFEASYLKTLDELNVQAEKDDENGAAGVQPCYDYPNDLGDLY